MTNRTIEVEVELLKRWAKVIEGLANDMFPMPYHQEQYRALAVSIRDECETAEKVEER